MSRSWEGGSDTRWRAFRAAILQRDHHTCTIAGPKCVHTATHVDHVVPLVMGGQKYDPRNARAACEPCNTGRRVAVVEEPAPRRVSNW